jgi:hypothetical protein
MLTLCVFLVGAWLAWRAHARLARVLAALPTDPAPLTRWLGRHPGPEALASLAAALDAGRDGALGHLASAVTQSEGPARVGACNEALHAVEGELGRGEGEGGASLRACVYATGFAAVTSLALRHGPSVELFDALALGAGFAFTIAAADRAADRAAREARRSLDRWVEAALNRGREGPSLPVDRAQ